jgi:chromosome segregation protein
MNITTLTLNERERLAYAEGYTETAALLAEMADLETRADALESELEDTKDRLDKTETNYYALIEERDELEDELMTAREESDAQRLETGAWHEEYKKLRVALTLALELLENPDADAFMADAVAHLREVLA